MCGCLRNRGIRRIILFYLPNILFLYLVMQICSVIIPFYSHHQTAIWMELLGRFCVEHFFPVGKEVLDWHQSSITMKCTQVFQQTHYMM